MLPPIPQPTIFLRNKFAIRPGMNARFFEGQEALLQHTSPELRLIAACGDQPLIRNRHATPPPNVMLHLWLLPAWDSLYRAMYIFSESDWYTSEVSSLASEHQDLLVGTGHGIETSPRPAWRSRDSAGYVYLYEEVLLNGSITKLAYLRHLNWLASELRARGCRLVCLATEITGTPSQLCILWSAPDVLTVDASFRDLMCQKPFARRFAEMMSGVGRLVREYMYPESTEQIDNSLESSK